MKQRKKPMRQCVGCMERKLKDEMIRVVRLPDGTIELDRTGKASGRGVYVCPEESCLEKAQKARRLERSLSCQIPEEVFDGLQKEMKRGNG